MTQETPAQMKRFLRSAAAMSVAAATLLGGLSLGPASALAAGGLAPPTGFEYVGDFQPIWKIDRSFYGIRNASFNRYDRFSTLEQARKSALHFDAYRNPQGRLWFKTSGEGPECLLDGRAVLAPRTRFLSTSRGFPTRTHCATEVNDDDSDTTPFFTWDGDKLVSTKGYSVQTYRDVPATPTTAEGHWLESIVGGRAEFAGDASAVDVKNGGLAAAPSSTVTLERGKTVRVPVRADVTGSLTSLDGTLTLTAPQGSTFASSTVTGQYRKDAQDAWQDTASLTLQHVQLGTGGTTLSGTVDSIPEFKAEKGYQFRWLAPVKAGADASGGAGSVGYTLEGTTNHGATKVQGTSPTTLAQKAIATTSYNADDDSFTLTLDHWPANSNIYVNGASNPAGPHVGKTDPDGHFVVKLPRSVTGGEKIHVRAWSSGTPTAVDIRPAAVTDLKAEIVDGKRYISGKADPKANVYLSPTEIAKDAQTFTAGPDGSFRAEVSSAFSSLTEAYVYQWQHGVRTKTTLPEVADNGGQVPATSPETKLERGKGVRVPAAVESTTTNKKLNGTVTFTAPEGTTFDGNAEVAGQWRTSDTGNWSGNDSTLGLTDVEVTDGGKTLTGTVDSSRSPNFTQQAGYQLRWLPTLIADEDAPAGAGTLGYTLVGATTHGTTKVEGTSPVVVPDAPVTVQPLVVQTPLEGSTTANRTPYFMGWGEPGAEIVITDENGTEYGRTTVDGNGWWGKVAERDVADGQHTFAVTQTVRGSSSTVERHLTVDSIRDLTIESPTDGSEGWYPSPSLIGWGTPGARVQITDEKGRLLGEETINDDGWFGAVSRLPLAGGEHEIMFTQQANGASQSTTVTYTLGLKELRVESPVDDGSSWWPSPSFIGWATPGATVTVRDTDQTVITEVVANDDGWFGVVSPRELSGGEHTLTFEQAYNGLTASTTTTYTIAPEPLVLEQPTAGYQNWWPYLSISGWATPSSSVVAVDEDGRTIATTTSNDEGWFGVVSDVALDKGEHRITVTQKTPAGDSSTTVTVTIT